MRQESIVYFKIDGNGHHENRAWNDWARKNGLKEYHSYFESYEVAKRAVYEIVDIHKSGYSPNEIVNVSIRESELWGDMGTVFNIDFIIHFEKFEHVHEEIEVNGVIYKSESTKKVSAGMGEYLLTLVVRIEKVELLVIKDGEPSQ